MARTRIAKKLTTAQKAKSHDAIHKAAAAVSGMLPHVLTARDLRLGSKLFRLEFPELGGFVYYREPSAAVLINRPPVSGDPNSPENRHKMMSYLICKSIVDESGAQIFADEDADTLQDTLGIVAYVRMMGAVSGRTGLTGAADLVEGLPKNVSTATPSSDLPTD
jgi:hypothetical protein